MCFIEYLGYTCGHTGDSVLRPCPLTTRAHVNPVCPVPAVRPQLSRDHCPACQRVMHNRWVDIMEEEHRWMHERGACGCPVEFPALMQPRMIGRDGPDYGAGAGGAVSGLPNAPGHGQGHGYGYGRGQSTGSTGSGSGSGGGSYHKPGNSRNRNKNKKASNKPGRGRGGGGNAKHQHQHQWKQQQQQQQQPQSQSHQTKAQTQQQRRQQQRERYPAFEEVRDGENDNDVRYVIRQPSMYGVEWTWDHAKLHEDGRCGCAVRFDKYDPSPSKDLRDVKHPDAGASSDGDHDAGKHVAPYIYSGNTNNQLLVCTGGGDPSLSYRLSGDPTTAPTSRLGPQVSGGQPARWSYDTPAKIHNLQEICALPARGADDSPRQLDMQTAWFGHQHHHQQQQAPMAGLPPGLGPECRDPSGHLQAEGQIVLYDVSQQVPLLGLPIGAGPEGLSHAGDFEDCELYRLGHAAQGLRRCSSTAF
ncbi:hypothetical protein DL770_006274 [Monosporascus sp. CRB-9-2]|nr:hypothetical protein DL770_006274 [Monosporascus sp. CRB-9-2]